MTKPITALYAGILALLILVLAVRVVMQRKESSVGLGDGGNETLLRRIRIHGNAVENIPIALVLMLVLELNGSSALLLNIFGGALVVGRLAHPLGITGSSGDSAGRLIGNVLTWTVIGSAAIRCVLLFFE